jgi:hypothetical protein
VPPSSGSKNKPRKECRLNFNALHGVLSQKIELFLIIAVKTYNPTYKGNPIHFYYIEHKLKERAAKNSVSNPGQINERSMPKTCCRRQLSGSLTNPTEKSEKLTVAYTVKILSPYTEPEGSLPCLEELATKLLQGELPSLVWLLDLTAVLSCSIMVGCTGLRSEGSHSAQSR